MVGLILYIGKQLLHHLIDIGIGLAAVSYTHLDVYKRQVLPRLGSAFILFTSLIASTVSAFGTSPLISKGILSVSYTHLDVYKRQVFYTPAPPYAQKH